MVIEKIESMLRACDGDESRFPPTELYNEGWLLRILLDWFSSNRVEGQPLSFAEDATWFSEALLPSAFLPRRHKDPLGEKHTHADGIIGHFRIGKDGQTDLSLNPDATQFVVLEGKIFSSLSPDVTHAPGYDQAARTVACMVEVISRTVPYPENLSTLGFYVLAPAEREAKFQKLLDRESIERKAVKRVESYRGVKDEWLEKWFLPLLPKISIGFKTWEDLLQVATQHDPGNGGEISEFYQRCLLLNAPKVQQAK